MVWFGFILQTHVSMFPILLYSTHVASDPVKICSVAQNLLPSSLNYSPIPLHLAKFYPFLISQFKYHFVREAFLDIIGKIGFLLIDAPLAIIMLTLFLSIIASLTAYLV